MSVEETKGEGEDTEDPLLLLGMILNSGPS